MKEASDRTERQTLCWPGRLLSEDDLRRHLTSQTEILLALRTVVTPLALDHLRDKRVRIRRQEASANGSSNGRAGSVSDRSSWGYAQETNDALVRTVIAALQREGISLIELPGATPLEWARRVAGSQTSEGLKTSEVYAGAVIFSGNAGLASCIANKVPGVRAVAVTTPAQVKHAKGALAPNLVAVEMPGRTLHELRQIVRLAVGQGPCPASVAKVLQELDGYAHR